MTDPRGIPRWTRALLRWLAPRDHADSVVGDLEETHRLRAQRHGPLEARVRTSLDTLDMASALVRTRVDIFGIYKGSGTLQDYKLALRMLVKFPGLTIAGGFSLAIAIGLGAGWWDFTRDLWRPQLPFPAGDRIVTVEMRDTAGGRDEYRIAHDFLGWKRDARTIEELTAYRTVERSMSLGSATPERITTAETTASMFRVVQVPPVLGRPLIDTDEQPGAPPVVVLGYDVWKRRFAGRSDVVGQTLQLGRVTATVVGVMPEGFQFPINHRMWAPLPLDRSGYAPLDGPSIRVFGLVAAGATQAQANVEVATLTQQVKKASPATHRHFVPRVLAYGGESPGDRSILEIAITYLPIIMVLVLACANVGTLVYARTATRDAEISVRYALGATRGRIITQLFVEALVLASVSAILGLAVANWTLKWALTSYFAGQLPFWLDPGLKPSTVLFAIPLTVLSAAILGVLPALKATGKNAQAQLKNLGAGGSTLRFGKVWTAAMIGQVALTVILIPPAIGISEESWRDRVIRSKFPTTQYLAIEIDADATRRVGEESAPEFAARFERTYREIERRISQQSEVAAVTYGDRLPGMDIDIDTVEVELAPGAPPVQIDTVWRAGVGPGYFEAFDVPIVSGREFHDGDRTPNAHTVLVNENFARVHFKGGNPIGGRVRSAARDGGPIEPWFEIVGLVRDVGMQPTDRGEAPFIYSAATLATARPLVMGIRHTSDAATLSPRVRAIIAEVDPDLRLVDVRSLEDLAWAQDLPGVVVSASIATIVALGLILSAFGIFALMSVSVARRRKEIGLRAALGATPTRLLAGVFARALVLIGSGIAAGNSVLLLFVYLSEEIELSFVADALLWTSAVMLTVGLLACIEPARRALRIHPTDALKEA